MSTAVTHDDLAVAPLRLEEAESVSGRAAGLELWLGGTIIAMAVIATVAVRVAGIGNPNRVDLLHTLAPPSLEEPFGTDALGRSVFLRTIYATGLDLWIGAVTTLLPLVIGMIVGLVSGYFGGWCDALFMRIVDALLAFPFIVLIIGFVAVFGAGLTGAFVGLTVASVPVFARITRGEMLILREQQFILAARTLAYPSSRIVFRHAMPHLLRPNIVIVPSVILANILTLAALSFLGLGVQPPTPEWGAIIANGQTYLFTGWWISTLPGLFVVLVGIGLSLAGEGLIDRFHLRKA